MKSKKEIEAGAKRPSIGRARCQCIPKELRERPQWVVWGWRRRKRKWNKIPYSAAGREAKANDPRTWFDFTRAVTASRADRSFDGVGYEFAADDPYTGIDLDDAIDAETKQLKPWARGTVDPEPRKSPRVPQSETRSLADDEVIEKAQRAKMATSLVA